METLYEKNLVIKTNKLENMKFDIEVIDKTLNFEKEKEQRIVVRGIMIKDNKLLVVYPKNEKLYGTPGGGVDANETLKEALKRELKEEVGANKLDIIEYVGKMASFRNSFLQKEKIYNPIHHYFLVNITEFGETKLLDYEQELGLSYDFLSIDDIILSNKFRLNQRKQEHLDFYTNQTIVFELIKKLYMI